MTEELFMKLVSTIVAIYILVIGIQKFFKTRQITSIRLPQLSPINKYTIKDLLTFLAQNKNVRNKALFTIGILCVIRMLYFLPMPGLNTDVLTAFFRNMARASIANAMLSRAAGSLSVFSFGIMPFISACLLIQLSSIFIPKIRKVMFDEGEKGWFKLERYSHILTMIIVLFQSYFMSIWLENPARFQGFEIVTIHGLHFRIMTMVTLTGATLLLIFLARMINKYGLGNGYAMIIVLGILTHMFLGSFQIHYVYKEGRVGSFTIFLIVAGFLGLLYVAFYFTNRANKVKLKNETTQHEATIPFRINWVSDIPVGLAQNIYLLPASLAAFISPPGLQELAARLTTNTWLYLSVMAFLIFVFTYLYSLVIFKPKRMQSLLEKYGFSIMATDSKEPRRYLEETTSSILLLTSIFLIIATSISLAFTYFFNIPYIAEWVIAGLKIMILAGVFSDVLKQLEFLYDREKANTKYDIAYVALDEVEAIIKSEYLKNKGMKALVEPLRFSWGIPIRTAVDQYRIYAPIERIEEARNFLG